MSEDWGIAFSELAGNATDIRYAVRDLPGLKAACDLCRDFSCVVQAGANCGVFTLYLLQRFEQVHAFEPDKDSFEALCENAPSYLYQDRLFKYDAALGAASMRGYLQLRRRDGSMGHPGTHHVKLSNDGSGIPINVGTIDALKLPACGLIFLDVEGMECDALKGARETIARCRPVISIEINKNLDFIGLKPSDVNVFMASLGYLPSGPVITSDRYFLPRE